MAEQVYVVCFSCKRPTPEDQVWSPRLGVGGNDIQKLSERYCARCYDRLIIIPREGTYPCNRCSKHTPVDLLWRVTLECKGLAYELALSPFCEECFDALMIVSRPSALN